MDSNKTRVRRQEEWRKNKASFDDVMGDPYSIDKEGAYNNLRRRSCVKVADNDFGSVHATGNPARPIASDFFVDVENIIDEVILDDELWVQFSITYMVGDPTDPNGLSLGRRPDLEQRLGKLFRLRHVSPVSEYFRTIRRRYA